MSPAASLLGMALAAADPDWAYWSSPFHPGVQMMVSGARLIQLIEGCS